MEPEDSGAGCPVCHANVFYRYGRTKQGKQRVRCLMCGRQFTLGPVRARVENKPACPNCGKTMHLYKREKTALRFRCSGYPKCRTFEKIQTEEER